MPRKSNPKNTDFDKMSTTELVNHLTEITGVPVPKTDVRIMRKCHITGFSLVNSGTEQAFEKVGLSWGTSTSLMRIKEYFLGAKKRKADEAGLANQEHDKRLLAAFQPSMSQPRRNTREHVKEGSGDTTDTQKSNRRRGERFDREVKIAQERAPELQLTAQLSADQRRWIIELFHKSFEGPDNAKFVLSSPNITMELPFPFLGTEIPNRFVVQDDQKRYQFMGREVFSDLVDAFDSLKKSFGRPNLWIYGLMGYGKSYLLATLTCFLTAYGYRVVYIPDCRMFLEDSPRYIKQCLMYTWGDIPEMVEGILDLKDMEEVANFITVHWNPSLVFVIDQLNALDDGDEDSTKAQARRWLSSCRSGLKAVLNTSANNTSFHRMTQRQNYDDVLTVYGGFTRREMDAWWMHYGSISLANHTRDEVEDYTGCNPLLLFNCLERDGFNLASEEITRMIRHAERFVGRMKDNCTEWGWTRYASYVKACITENYVPGDIDLNHIDHRFFHENKGIGYCICGAIRDAVIKQLTSSGTHLFSIDDCLAAMGYLNSNPSVVGYFLEHAIIRSIATSGLPCFDIVGPMAQLIFHEFPRCDLSLDKALYVPRKFNFPAIDAIFLRLDHTTKKAELFPIQITVQKGSHRNSEDHFFKDLPNWKPYLERYNIKITFLWIASGNQFQRTEKKAKARGRRDGSETKVWPNYESVVVPLHEVNCDVWRYQETRKAEEEFLALN